MKILLNAVRCDSCKRVLASLHRHDFRSCACGVAVDGGRDYLRRVIPDGHTVTDLTLVLKDDKFRMLKDLEN